MRKLLLTTAALTACAWSHAAVAQTQSQTATEQAPALPFNPMQGMLPSRPSPTPPAGANNSNNTATTPTPGPVANPTPGTVVIHFNGRVLTEVNGSWSSLDQGSFPAVTGTGGTIAPAGNYKTAPASIASYARLYTGVDAMAANGLRYGGAIEIRENFTGQSPSTTSTGASGYSSSETLFVRRSFGYVAADTAGIVRFGQGDGLISLFDNGITTFQFLPSMNLQSGDLSYVAPINTQVPFAFLSGSGNEYGNSKLVYLSPRIAGFDVGVQWAPNTANGFGNGASTTYGTIPGCPTAGSGCPNESASTVAADGARILNQTAVGIRYDGRVGPVALKAYGVYEFGGHTKYNGAFIQTGSATARASGAGTGRFDNLSFGNAGVALTYAGFTVGGNWVGGAVNGIGAARPAGGAPTQGWLVGALYKTGPLAVGGSFESINSQGAVQLAGVTQRHEIGLDLAVSYNFAPGLLGWIEYLYQQREQNGFNFASGSASTNAGSFNQVKSQGLQLGTTVFW